MEKKYLIASLNETPEMVQDGYDTKTIIHATITYDRYGDDFDTEQEALDALELILKGKHEWDKYTIIPIYVKKTEWN